MTIVQPEAVRLFLRFAAVFIVSTSGASAQTTAVPGFTQPDDDETVVRKLLQSTDPRAQAWGAWYAGRDQMRQLAPLVHAVIAQHAFGTSLPESAAVEVSLDTLIQLKVPTPAPLLAAVYERRPAQSLILAAIADRDDQEIEPFLLGVLARDKYDEWFAAANTLLGRRASGLAVSIIRALRIPVHVYITRDGRTTGGGSGTGMGVGMGCGAVGAARGLPPWADYRLATSAHPGYVVLSTGPTTVYYQRIVTAAGSTPARSVVERDGPAADDRLRYLAALAGLSADSLPLRGMEFREITLATGAPANGALETVRRGLLDSWSVIARALVHTSALSREDAASVLPAFDLVVNDSQ